ncbi:MAG: BTAD domain-containing putative transcriptional regulator [Alphaproteobacteria bacterium]
MRAQHRIRLEVLGPFRATDRAGGAVTPLGRHAQALLAVLALAGVESVSRDRITALLWERRGEAQARHSLRQCLLGMRKALDDHDAEILVANPGAVRLASGTAEIDARTFEELVTRGGSASLRAAAELYRGDLLEGLFLQSEGFEEWLTAQRSLWRGRMRDVLQRLAELEIDSGNSEGAVEASRRLVALDSLHEPGHRVLMRAYALADRRADALRQFAFAPKRSGANSIRSRTRIR